MKAEADKPAADLSRAKYPDQDVMSSIKDMFETKEMDEEQKSACSALCHELQSCLEAIVRHVPPGPDRSAAIRKLREVRYDCNSAISHDGKY